MLSNSNNKKSYLEKFLETISPLDHLKKQKTNQIVEEVTQQVLVFFEQATLAFQQNNYVKAEQFYLHSLEIVSRHFASAPEALRSYMASALYNVGNTQKYLGKNAEALQHLTRATQMYLPLVQQNPAAFATDLADTFLQLGQLQLGVNDVAGAEHSFSSALIHFQQIGQPTLEQQYQIAHLSVKLAQVYAKNYQYDLAKKYYQKGVGNYRRLAIKSPDRFTSKLLETLSNFAEFLEKNAQVEEAVFIHLDIAKMYRKLALKNPRTYLEKEAGTLTWVAALWSKSKEHEKAAQYFLKAIPIWKKLSASDFDAYFPTLVKAHYNVAVCYNNLNKKAAAIEYFQLTLNGKLELAQVNPKDNLKDVRDFLEQFSTILKDFHEIEKMETIFEEAIQTVEGWTPLRQEDWFLFEVSALWRKLAHYFIYILEYEKAKNAVEKSLEIRRDLAAKNPLRYEEYLVESLMSYGDVFNIFGEGALLKENLDEVTAILKNNLETTYYSQCKAFCKWQMSILHFYWEEVKSDEKAEATTAEALHLMKVLAAKNEEVYMPYVFKFVNRYGWIKLKLSKLAEAEELFVGAKEVADYLIKKDWFSHETKLGDSLSAFGDLAIEKKEYITAEKEYLAAGEIFKKAAKKRPWEYNLSLANVYHNLASIYKTGIINEEKSLIYANNSASLYAKYKDKLKCSAKNYEKVVAIIDFWKNET